MKVLQGIVTSVKSAKTATVTVVRQWQHPVYKKYVKRTKKYAAHVEELELKEGDVVVIEECRPISKTKNFKVTSKLENAKPVVMIDEVKPVSKKKKTEAK